MTETELDIRLAEYLRTHKGAGAPEVEVAAL
jgi:hypothetical protein